MPDDPVAPDDPLVVPEEPLVAPDVPLVVPEVPDVLEPEPVVLPVPELCPVVSVLPLRVRSRLHPTRPMERPRSASAALLNSA